MFVVVRTESGPTPRNRTAPRVTNHAGRETAADGPRRSVAGANRCTPSAASPPGDAASVTVREDRVGDATSEKAVGESESDVRARVGGEEQEPRGDGDGSKGDDAATRGPPRRPRTPSRARPAARALGRTTMSRRRRRRAAASPAAAPPGCPPTEATAEVAVAVAALAAAAPPAAATSAPAVVEGKRK